MTSVRYPFCPASLLIPVESTVDVMVQAAVGLKSLHDKGLIHLDVKAANYLVQRSVAGFLIKVSMLAAGIYLAFSIMLL
jgi:serine/threonine protein kinase